MWQPSTLKCHKGQVQGQQQSAAESRCSMCCYQKDKLDELAWHTSNWAGAAFRLRQCKQLLSVPLIAVLHQGVQPS